MVRYLAEDDCNQYGVKDLSREGKAHAIRVYEAHVGAARQTTTSELQHFVLKIQHHEATHLHPIGDVWAEESRPGPDLEDVVLRGKTHRPDGAARRLQDTSGRVKQASGVARGEDQSAPHSELALVGAHGYGVLRRRVM